jgi:hypothetical protein
VCCNSFVAMAFKGTRNVHAPHMRMFNPRRRSFGIISRDTEPNKQARESVMFIFLRVVISLLDAAAYDGFSWVHDVCAMETGQLATQQ